MKQIKKSLLLQFVVIFLMLSVHSVCNATSQSYVYYSAENEMIEIRGAGKKLSELPVVIVPYGKDEGNLSDLTDDQILIHLLYTDKNGNFDESIGARSTWGNGFYKAVITSGEDRSVSWFMFAENVDSILPIINSGNIGEIKSALMSNGMVDAWSASYIDSASKYLYNNRPSSGYSADEFLKSYVSGLALECVKKGDDTLKNVICKFSGYTDIDIAEYLSYSSAMERELESFVKISTDKDSFKNIYDKYLIVTRINFAETDSELQKVILDNREKIGINISKYNSLNNNYSRLQVFSKMMGKRYSSMEEIKTEFDSACTAVANQSSNSVAGGASGGGSSGGGALGGLGKVGDVKIDMSELSGHKVFSDLENHWSKTVVERLAELGIINGYPDGTFAPDGVVTRAEFAKMVCSALGTEKASYNGAFSDVSDSDWFSGYISGLYERGIISGIDGRFEPNRQITRQDAAVIIWRSVCYCGYTDSGTNSLDFNDISSVADYAKESVKELSGLGIINGYEGRFNPTNNLTRAEAAQVVKGLINVCEIKTER